MKKKEFLDPISSKFHKQFFFTFAIGIVLALVGGFYIGSIL